MGGKWLWNLVVVMMIPFVFWRFRNHPDDAVAFIAAMVFGYVMLDKDGGK